MSGESNPSVSSPSGTSGQGPAQNQSGQAGQGAAPEVAVDWNEFTEDQVPTQPEGGLAGPSPAAKGGTQPGVASTQATTDGSDQPPAAPPSPTAPLAVPQQPQEVPSQVGAEGPAFNPYDPSWQAGQIEALTPHFQLSEEQASQVMTEPHVVLPQLAARLMLMTRLEIAHLMSEWGQQVVPKLFEGMLGEREQKQTTRQTVEKEIFGPYPELQRVPQETLAAMAKSVRQALPNATPKQRLDTLARGAYTLYGWQMPGQRQPQAQPAQAAAMPFMPMAPGAAPPMPPPAGANGRDPNNIWEEFLER